MNGLRTVQHSYVAKQYKLSADALLDEQKFLAYVRPPNFHLVWTLKILNFCCQLTSIRRYVKTEVIIIIILNRYVNNCSHWTQNLYKNVMQTQNKNKLNNIIWRTAMPVQFRSLIQI